MVDLKLLENCFSLLKEKQFKLVTAESLTAGMIACEFAKIPGASSVLWGGIIAYDTEVKQSMLFVPKETIEKYGVISSQTAMSMAKGALQIFSNACKNLNCRDKNFTNSNSSIAVAVTGVAGPDKQENKSVGIVHIAIAKQDSKNNLKNKIEILAEEYFFKGNRQEIREQTVNQAMELISWFLKN